MFLVDKLRLSLIAHVSVAIAVAVFSILSLAFWRARLGHASSSRVQQLSSRGLLGSISIEIFLIVFHVS